MVPRLPDGLPECSDQAAPRWSPSSFRPLAPKWRPSQRLRRCSGKLPRQDPAVHLGHHQPAAAAAVAVAAWTAAAARCAVPALILRAAQAAVPVREPAHPAAAEPEPTGRVVPALQPVPGRLLDGTWQRPRPRAQRRHPDARRQDSGQHSLRAQHPRRRLH